MQIGFYVNQSAIFCAHFQTQKMGSEDLQSSWAQKNNLLSTGLASTGSSIFITTSNLEAKV